MNIDKMIADVIAREGGFTDNPHDHGGPTHYGVTLKALDAYTGRKNTTQDIKNLKKSMAAQIFKVDYYFTPGIDHLPLFIQGFVFDMAVNHGPCSAIELLQHVLMDYGLLTGAVDGLIGPQTIAASNKAVKLGWQRFINALVDRRIARYRMIVQYDNSQAVFEKGWIARAESFRVNRDA